MLLTDHLPPAAPPIGIQVFATDVDERALATARAGVFPEAILTDVPPMRLNRFFDKIENGYRVKKTLREQVMFARQNILRDPAFSRLDIITCRNLLMYLERGVQAEVLEVFHFALNPGGLLFLGTAETADFLPDHFTIIDKKNRIYRANPVRQARRDLLPLRIASGAPQRPVDVVQPARAPLAQLHQRMLETHAQVSVVIDGNRRILHTSQGASRYLRYVDGVPSQDLLEVVLPELVSPLRAALLLVGHTGKRVASRPVAIASEQGPITVQMVVRNGELAAKGGPMLVIFSEVDTSLAVSSESSEALEPAYLLLEEELQRLQQALEGTIGDSAVSSEALRATNEELQSMNEELRSATEELETSKEELQSVNEELTTVNFELKTKVEETAKANDDLSNLIGSMNMATVFVDRSMQIRGFTPLASQLFNIRNSDIGRPLHDLTHRLRYDGLAHDVEQVIAVLRPIEREIGTADGARWYLMRVTAYRTNEDRIDGAVLNFIDITERRNVQQELRARDERLRLVAESTEDYAMITLDAQGDISSWNTGAKLMFGYAPDEIVGAHFRTLFVPEDRTTGQPEYEMQQAAKHGRAADERWHMRKDGGRFYCSGITTPILGSSGIEGYAKIARDLTERQLFERQREELLQKEKQVRVQLEAANALRGEFLAVMSHELKNPLNLILMSAELIGRSSEIQGAPELSRAVDTIRRTVNGQAQIIDDLLDLSRLSTGKMAISRSVVQWRAVIERIADALRTELRSRDLALEVVADDLPIYADVVRVEQIVWNLVSNALKFTPAGGRITMRLSREGSLARFDVTDTGRGIDPEFLPLVFNMFEQGDRRSSTRRDKGLGIGLALVKSLAELHGGSVEVSSAGIGHGATFTVRLPLFEGSWTGSGNPPAPDDNPLNGRTVLLVDDDADYLEMFASLLRKTGTEVTAVGDARTALAAAHANSFDVVISDIAMPDMDGRELIAELRKLPHGSSVVAIAVSGFGRSEDVELSKLAGFDAHLSKPLSLEMLGETLLQAVRKSE
jgi:two-component system CheB/CheR fusion protein